MTASRGVRGGMPAEGLFEELDAAPGQFEIKAFDSHGVRMGLLQFRADTIDDELLADLKRWQARRNLTRLRLVSDPVELGHARHPKAFLLRHRNGKPGSVHE